MAALTGFFFFHHNCLDRVEFNPVLQLAAISTNSGYKNCNEICIIINIAGRSVLLRVLKTPAVKRALIVGCGLQIIHQFTGLNILV